MDYDLAVEWCGQAAIEAAGRMDSGHVSKSGNWKGPRGVPWKVVGPLLLQREDVARLLRITAGAWRPGAAAAQSEVVRPLVRDPVLDQTHEGARRRPEQDGRGKHAGGGGPDQRARPGPGLDAQPQRVLGGGAFHALGACPMHVPLLVRQGGDPLPAGNLLLLQGDDPLLALDLAPLRGDDGLERGDLRLHGVELGVARHEAGGVLGGQRDERISVLREDGGGD